MEAVAEGIRRVTFPLPLGIDHVHCYFLRGDDGWTLVDTGLGVHDPEAQWGPVPAQLAPPAVPLAVTPFQPDPPARRLPRVARAHRVARAYDRARRARDDDYVTGRAGPCDRRASRRAARTCRGCARRHARDGVRRLALALPLEAFDRAAALRARRVARSSRT